MSATGNNLSPVNQNAENLKALRSALTQAEQQYKTKRNANSTTAIHRARSLVIAKVRNINAKKRATRKLTAQSRGFDYIVIRQDNRLPLGGDYINEGFTTNVIEKLNEGYSLQGGICIGGDGTIYQAMVKSSSPKNLLSNNADLLSLEV